MYSETIAMNATLESSCETAGGSNHDDCVKTSKDPYGFKTSDGPKTKGLRIGKLNAQSMRLKMDVITSLIHKHRFDIFVIDETWQKKKHDDFSISNYGAIKLPREYGDGHGGILIFYHENITVKKQSSWEDKSTNVQYLCVKVTSPVELDLVAFYNPNVNHANVAYGYMAAMLSCRRTGDSIMMLGDFNIDLSLPTNTQNPKYEQYLCKHADIKKELKLKQIIEYYTRVEKTSKTLIDHIYTNIPLEESSAETLYVGERGVIRSGISDHDLIYCTLRSRVLDALHKTFDRVQITAKIEQSVSISKLMQSIANVTDKMDELHGSYSTIETPSDIMSEAVDELEKMKIKAVKDRNIWSSIKKKRKHFTKSKDKDTTNTKMYHQVSQMLEPPNKTDDDDALTQHHMYKWAISLGHLQGIDALIDKCKEQVLPLIDDIHKSFISITVSKAEEQGHGIPMKESTIERLIYDCLEAKHMISQPLASSVSSSESSASASRAETLGKLTAYLKNEKRVVGCFYQFGNNEPDIFARYFKQNFQTTEYTEKQLKGYIQLRYSQHCADLSRSPLLSHLLNTVKESINKQQNDRIKAFACDNELCICVTERSALTNIKQILTGYSDLLEIAESKKCLKFFINRNKTDYFPSCSHEEMDHEPWHAELVDKHVDFLGIRLDYKLKQQKFNTDLSQNLETLSKINACIVNMAKSMQKALREGFV